MPGHTDWVRMSVQGVWVITRKCCKAIKYACLMHCLALWRASSHTLLYSVFCSALNNLCNTWCRFEDLLRSLTVERKDICDAMIFALDNADSAFEVCSTALQAFLRFRRVYNLGFPISISSYDLRSAGHSHLSVPLEASRTYTGIPKKILITYVQHFVSKDPTAGPHLCQPVADSRKS